MWMITTSGMLSLASPQSPRQRILDALQLSLSVEFQVNKSCARELNPSRCGSQMSDFDFIISKGDYRPDDIHTENHGEGGRLCRQTLNLFKRMFPE